MTRLDIVNVPDGFRRPHATHPAFAKYNLERYFYAFMLRRPAPRISAAYVPLFWSDIYSEQHSQLGEVDALASETVQSVLDGLDASRNYFSVAQCDYILERVPKYLRIFGAGGMGDVAVPLVTDFRIRRRRSRDIFCSFSGAIEVGGPVPAELRAGRASWDADGPGAVIRRAMYDALCHEPDFVFQIWDWPFTGEWKSQTRDGRSRAYRDEYRELLSRSVFTLCPRGYGLTSFRLYEALKAGSIPVYISDAFWLPYGRELDWADIAVLVQAADVRRIASILRSIPQTAISRLQSRGADLAASHFSLQGVSRWILQHLADRETRQDADLSSADPSEHFRSTQDIGLRRG